MVPSPVLYSLYLIQQARSAHQQPVEVTHSTLGREESPIQVRFSLGATGELEASV